MDADERRLLDEITERIIGALYSVSDELGVGYLEKVYENALAYEIRKAGLQVEQQTPLRVTYDGVVVGEYYCDLLVESRVIVELKHCKELHDSHLAQTLNYLKATKLHLALLVSIGKPRVEVRRVVMNF